MLVGVVCLAASACGSGGGGSSAATTASTTTHKSKPSAPPKSHLRPGGVRKIARGPRGQKILAVVYDVVGRVRPQGVRGATAGPGRRFAAVHLAIENLGKGYYQQNPVATATARDDKGRPYRPPKKATVHGGLHKLHLAPGESRGGLVLFAVPNTARIRVFSFKPFPSARRAVYRLK